jgi:hypothetical protein
LVSLEEQREPFGEEKGVSQEGWSPPRSERNLLMGEGGVSLREQKEPPGWEKVGSLGTLGRESPSKS